MGPTDGILDQPQSGDDAAESRAEEVAPVQTGVTRFLRPLLALALLFLFLVGVQALSSGIKGLGAGVGESLLSTVRNPFVGLVTGILATTLVQSSSVTTSLVVTLTANGTIPLQFAIPIVMGANIGTTVTNTIAALAQVGRRTEFRRAFAAATCHDFFNWLTVAALLPLELATGFLQKSSILISGWLPTTTESLSYKSPFKVALKTSVGVLESIVGVFTDSTFAGSIMLIVLAVVVIFVSLILITKVMKTLVLSRMEGLIRRVLGRGFKGGALSILAGMFFTILVQSSSITTSVMVPLAGAGLVRLWQVFPVTVGANIGTTVTAIIASMAFSGPKGELARQIAIVHLLFNVSGMLLFYVPPYTRRWPMVAAQWLAKIATKSRRWALLYIVVVFYGVPAALVFLSR